MAAYTITMGRYSYTTSKKDFEDKSTAEKFLDGLNWRQIENIVDILKHGKSGDRPAWKDFF